MPEAKLYVAVRADLDPGLQAAQAVHAGQEFVFEHPETARAWRDSSNIVVLIEVPDVSALCALIANAELLEVKATPFYDNDLDIPLTAVVLEPGQAARRLCRRYPKALRRAA